MSTQNGERPATKRQVATLTRLARMHGRQDPKPDLNFEEASDAIRWLSTRQRKGEEFAPVPPADPELAPYMTLRHWETERPNTRRPA